jgi:hypothetical protein
LEELERAGQGSAFSLSNRHKVYPLKKNSACTALYDYKTVRLHLQSLEEIGAVRRISDPKKLGRSQEIIFEPTLLGLVHYLESRQPTPHTMKQVAQKFEQALPLVFRKWSYFEKFKPPSDLVEITGGPVEVDAVVCKALNGAANEIVRTHPPRIAFAFDVDELAPTRKAWQSDPYSGTFRTVDEYIETELRRILEPRALLLHELLHPYPWSEPSTAKERQRPVFSSAEPIVLWSALAGDAELRRFAVEWLWHQRLEALQEAKRTDRVEQQILNPTYVTYPFKLRMENPSSIQILLWEQHWFERHAERQPLAYWDSLGHTRMYPRVEEVRCCYQCGRETTN